MANKKVYCNTCTYLKGYVKDWDVTYKHSCAAPSNIKIRDTYYCQEEEIIAHPKEINKYNNCPWYKERGN
jgi:hypothetical protein